LQRGFGVFIGFHKAEEPVSERPTQRWKKILTEEDPARRRRKKNFQRMAGRKRMEEDPISNRPFWASFISPVANVNIEDVIPSNISLQ
jgi:hypothetical protein